MPQSCFWERYLVYVMPAVTCSPKREDRFRRNRPSEGVFLEEGICNIKVDVSALMARALHLRSVCSDRHQFIKRTPVHQLRELDGCKGRPRSLGVTFDFVLEQVVGVQLATGMDQECRTVDFRANEVLH